MYVLSRIRGGTCCGHRRFNQEMISPMIHSDLTDWCVYLPIAAIANHGAIVRAAWLSPICGRFHHPRCQLSSRPTNGSRRRRGCRGGGWPKAKTFRILLGSGGQYRCDRRILAHFRRVPVLAELSMDSIYYGSAINADRYGRLVWFRDSVHEEHSF